MLFHQYVLIREEERTATVQALLSEIRRLEEQMEKLYIAYEALKQGKSKETVGFKGGKSEEK